MSEFTPISEHGLIGNLETCALVDTTGAVDWCCFPHMESPSVFGSILDAERGGEFAIAPLTEYDAHQQYFDRTNVLQTTFETASGELTVTDFMPVIGEAVADKHPNQAIYRKVTCTEGTVDVEATFAPRFDYARSETTLESTSGGVRATGDGDDESAFLSTPTSMVIEDGAAHAAYSLDANETHWYVFQYDSHEPMGGSSCRELLDETVEYWHDWSHSCSGSDCPFEEIDHDHVIRSGLVLKLLTRMDTGSICAAPTTSLPENIGGVRNWDYRFSWIRDSAFTVQALTHLGYTTAADEYLNDYMELSRSTDPEDLQPLYGLDHCSDLEEETLDHLSGYRGSKPVRVGNEASSQFQLDIYGELVQTVYQMAWSDEGIVDEDWSSVSEIVEFVCETWDDPDSGIWEPRREPTHYVYSKVMCWSALDRAIDLAEQEGLDAPLDNWREQREEIRDAVIERGFDEEYDSFTQTFDGDRIDATGLLIPQTGFLPIDDERVQGTIEAVREHLTTPDGFVYRYQEGGDQMPGKEGAFILCSFWLVSALAKSGDVERAEEIFENVLETTSSVELFSEQVDVEREELLGNYPQAFSHIGLINSALYIAEAKRDDFSVESMGMNGTSQGSRTGDDRTGENRTAETE